MDVVVVDKVVEEVNKVVEEVNKELVMDVVVEGVVDNRRPRCWKTHDGIVLRRRRPEQALE